MSGASPRRVLLCRNGFCALQASTAADVYRLVSELPPAAVVTDVYLSGEEDGLCLTNRLKHDERTRNVPVVILTGCVFPRDREAAARAGCDVFVPKPCLPDALSAVVVSLLERAS